jgi:hypothetical protein
MSSDIVLRIKLTLPQHSKATAGLTRRGINNKSGLTRRYLLSKTLTGLKDLLKTAYKDYAKQSAVADALSRVDKPSVTKLAEAQDELDVRTLRIKTLERAINGRESLTTTADSNWTKWDVGYRGHGIHGPSIYPRSKEIRQAEEHMDEEIFLRHRETVIDILVRKLKQPDVSVSGELLPDGAVWKFSDSSAVALKELLTKPEAAALMRQGQDGFLRSALRAVASADHDLKKEQRLYDKLVAQHAPAVEARYKAMKQRSKEAELTPDERKRRAELSAIAKATIHTTLKL